MSGSPGDGQARAPYDRERGRQRSAPPAITASGVGLTYAGKPALRDVDLVADRGRITALVGPSGCGKSSFLHCCNRLIDLIPGTDMQGELTVAGYDLGVARLDLATLRRDVGLIAQQPTCFPIGIAANIDLALREHRFGDRRERRAIIEQVLRRVGLWEEVQDRLDALATTLSGGQQQRLCIARALALRPRVLLMDEPCSALDPLASERIEALIDELRGEVTILIVTHNLAQARRVADDVAVFWLRDGVGTCIEQGACEQIFTAPGALETCRYVEGLSG